MQPPSQHVKPPSQHVKSRFPSACPAQLLTKKDRGKGHDKSAAPLAYGAAAASLRVDGADLLEAAEAAGSDGDSDEGSDGGSDEGSEGSGEVEDGEEGEGEVRASWLAGWVGRDQIRLDRIRCDRMGSDGIISDRIGSYRSETKRMGQMRRPSRQHSAVRVILHWFGGFFVLRKHCNASAAEVSATP